MVPQLPIELWDNVISLLDVPQQSLLALCRVSHTFNTVAITHFLLREEVSHQSLAAREIEVNVRQSPLILSALAMSHSLHPLRRLVCKQTPTYANSKLGERLQCIQRIVDKSPNLGELVIEFDRNVFNSAAVVAAPHLLRTLLHRFVQTRAGTVAVFNGALASRCLAEDVLHWKFDDTVEYTGSGPRRGMRKLFGANQPTPKHGYVILRDDTLSRTMDPVASLAGVSLKRLATPSSLSLPGTIIELNPGRTAHLSLGPKDKVLSMSLTSAELDVVLPNQRIRGLVFLDITLGDISPPALSSFLEQNRTTLRQITYNPVQGSSGSLLTCPIALPALDSLHTADPVRLIELLDAFGSSPQLRSLHFCYPETGPESLTPVLARITRHQQDLALHLRQGDPGALNVDATPLSEACETATRALHHVTHIDIECPVVASAHTRAMIPWLALFPALQQVIFRSVQGMFRWGPQRQDPQPATVHFLEHAIRELPNVKEVLVKED
ncbi:hypothetical protein MIND_00921900 [Mycena indigotica]|uniref:F-box domain-containing protein n=1 Tax=Mycena indigotica TaxID=2126181 RepID=A0A8H6SC95_9AGAR|nr:uncharacterized protein MIND_00921900 [Mycena indigotica]KAF7296901.1 hypothetical protein MIND_00921900 [Mycena indigotica]